MSEDKVNHSQVGNVFMLGPGGFATIILAAYFGRLPVLFYFVILALLTAIWCSAATSFESFMAARILNGFFSTVAQGVSEHI
jgi:MFS family permease